VIKRRVAINWLALSRLTEVGGAPKGKANGSYKHGLHTQEARAERRLISRLLRESRKTIAALPEQDEK
jgi:hypothetical protein